MVNKVEGEVNNKDRWNAKGGDGRRNFAGLPQCHEIRIHKPINESETQNKSDIGTERAVSAVGIK